MSATRQKLLVEPAKSDGGNDCNNNNNYNNR